MPDNSFKNEAGNGLISEMRNAIFADMQTMAQRALNPQNYYLSPTAKKRLNWMYELYHRHNGNISKTHRRLGISRQWLSAIKNEFEQSGRDPRSLEPESRAPHDTSKRDRIPKQTENLIIKVRKQSLNVWGKEKIAYVMERDYGVKVDPNTANKYLHIHGLIDPKISLKNTNAWKAKKEREQNPQSISAKWRPPKAIKDYAPGALVERDLKFIPIPGKQSACGPANDAFWSQHTFIDSFTRIRGLELAAGHTAADAISCRQKIQARLPFAIASENSDNGSENNGAYHQELRDTDTFHFYSNAGTPTDNPRVERSHLTDDLEFYKKGGLRKTFYQQQLATADWENSYNRIRPHQALANLTPMEFYQLWKRDPGAAMAITKKWQTYLAKQRKRLALSRRIKNEKDIQNLMEFIDAKLDKKSSKKSVKSTLQNCQLCFIA
jgi:hypothetical protein